MVFTGGKVANEGTKWCLEYIIDDIKYPEAQSL
jgi:hypothetical protein